MSRSSQSPDAEILSVGMVTPIGYCAPETAAAARAGIARLRESYLYDQHGEPVVMGLVNDEDLPPLCDALMAAALPAPRRRLLRMAALALDEALDALDTPPGSAAPSPVPILLGAPEPRPNGDHAIDVGLLQQMAIQTGRVLDLQRSRLLPQGRAAGLLALAQALNLLARDEVPGVLVGGVDSYLDAGLVAALDEQGRLCNGEVQDGFIPGEAAAFVLVGRPGMARRLGRQPIARVAGVGLGRETGHLYSDKPYFGEGLAQAFSALFDPLPQAERVRTMYAGLNGETFWAKELGVARIRHDARFEEPVRTEHPADAIGDAGAALGPVMVGLAALALHGGYRAGPALVYCGSDREERAVALLTA